MRSTDKHASVTQERHDRRRRRFGGCLAAGFCWVISSATAIAQGGTTISAPEEPVPFEAVRAGPASPVSEAARPNVENLPDLTEITSWTIPPVRWGGNTLSNYNLSSDSSGTKSFNQTQTVNLHGSSFVYQPWFAQVSGNVGLLSGTATQGGTAAGNTSSRSSSATYGGNLNLFPQSRFPFQAYLQTSDSRASANSLTSQYTSTRMGATQSYRPEVGPENYTASADRSIVTSANIRSIVDALQGSFGTNIDAHSLSANARYSSTTGDLAGQGSKLLNLAGSHSWRSDEDLSLASSVNYSRNQINLLRGTALSRNDSEFFQAGSSLTWMPDEDLPLTIVGGGNFLHMTTLTETANVALNNINAYANANYRISNNLTAIGGLNIVRTTANGLSQMSLGQNGGISYSGNPLTFGEYSYNWGTGANIANQTITGGLSSRSISGQVQHSLLRTFTFSADNAVTLNATQSFALTSNSTTGQSGILTHAGGASWRLGVGERTVGMLSATASDSLSTGQFSSHFRSLSMQGNLQKQLSARSAVGGGLNVTVSQQLTAAPAPQPTIVPGLVPIQTTANGNRNVSGSAQIMYTHRSPFNITDLIYSAAFQANASQTNLRIISGDPNALAWQTGKVFQQSADYRLGRLIFRATTSVATLNGKKNASVFFMVGRDFGDF
jgi:hypothetical protein